MSKRTLAILAMLWVPLSIPAVLIVSPRGTTSHKNALIALMLLLLFTIVTVAATVVVLWFNPELEQQLLQLLNPH